MSPSPWESPSPPATGSSLDDSVGAPAVQADTEPNVPAKVRSKVRVSFTKTSMSDECPTRTMHEFDVRISEFIKYPKQSGWKFPLCGESGGAPFAMHSSRFAPCAAPRELAREGRSAYLCRVMSLGVGDSVRVALQGGRLGRVQDVRPGQVLVEFESGGRSWVPTSQVKKRGISIRPSERPPSAAPTKLESRILAASRKSTNPFRAPRVPTFHTVPPPANYTQIFFSFDGRIGRRQYWVALALIVLPVIILASLAAMLATSAGQRTLHVELVLLVMSFIPLLWASLAVASKRCHDLNWSGWWSLNCLIPAGGFLFFVFLGLLRGTRGPNEYGQEPHVVV